MKPTLCLTLADILPAITALTNVLGRVAFLHPTWGKHSAGTLRILWVTWLASRSTSSTSSSSVYINDSPNRQKSSPVHLFILNSVGEFLLAQFCSTLWRNHSRSSASPLFRGVYLHGLRHPVTKTITINTLFTDSVLFSSSAPWHGKEHLRSRERLFPQNSSCFTSSCFTSHHDNITKQIEQATKLSSNRLVCHDYHLGDSERWDAISWC